MYSQSALNRAGVVFVNISGFAQRLGAMRVALTLMAAALVVLVPWPGPGEDNELGAFRALVVPALSPILFMVLMLDVLMSRVQMADAGGEARNRYRFIIRFELVVALVLALSWLPYFISVTA